ncbi:MAG: hypothetical protein IT254_00555 [Chitinophagaceae bacterium]|nr:hypothetical protein [Bacteroidota bacterium]MCC6256788.1 hypothetical protein [Chitinophagaceae bacterium]
MRIVFSLFFCVLIFGYSQAQPYNNEWIDFSKTYYKFPVGSAGLYQISQSALAGAGLGAVPAQNFQLWRNGKEVPLYTSVTTGPLGVNDFLQFFGEMNDGKADKVLYKYDSLQISDKWSLYTDSAMYFLTVNSSPTNKRYTTLANNVQSNVLLPQTGFIYTLSKYYKDVMNNGFAVDYGEMLYSASYETGEGWTSNNVGPGSIQDNNTNLFVDNSSSSGISLDVQMAGNMGYLRHVKVKLNGTELADTLVNGYAIKRFHITGQPISLISSNTALVEIVNAGTGSDKIVVGGYQLTYPRQFNFGGQSIFSFNIPAGPERYIEISNFNFGDTPPVLLDPVNLNRILGDISGGIVRFVLPATSLDAKYILLNASPSGINHITSFALRNFIDHSLPSQQGNYIIISNPLLYDDGAGHNQVELYRQYRASSAGGNFNAVVMDINELTDQFAFGIKHHPLAIRNYGYYCLSHFISPPTDFLLIGKGLNYKEFRKHESDPNISEWALVPTFGYPASDNLLFAQRTQSYQQVNVGRLSAVTGKEVGDYLSKVKQFELNQVSGPQTIQNKGWMKNVAQVTGAIADPSLATLINSFMVGYRNTISDTFFGGHVYSFNRNSGSYTASESNISLDALFNEGLSYLTYFGHSSPNTLEFNLDNPQNYSNTGKYPLIMVNGCNTGNLFLFDTLRAFNNGTLSEKYLFAEQKGSIGFISDTHFGLPQQLDYFTSRFNKNLSSIMYGSALGSIMRSTAQYLVVNNPNDYATRIHAEEITLHGDPAIRLNPFSKPDYVITDSLISINPTPVTVGDTAIVLTLKILNIGKAISDSMSVMIRHQLPDQSVELVQVLRIPSTRNEDIETISIPIDPIAFSGTNKIMISIDPDNEIQESSESNNTAEKVFEIIKDAIRPVFPYNYSIVGNDAGLTLFGSTADPLMKEKTYVMEMDTTRFFNSPLKISRAVSDSGGVLSFIPGNSLIDSTVYYWRLTVAPVTVNSFWQNSSFTFIRNAGTDGYAQSQFFQHTDSKYSSMQLDTLSRIFKFDDKTRRLMINTGLYPYYLYDQIDVNIDNDKVELYGCLYNSLQFVVYNPLSLTPWKNWNVNSNSGRFGSAKICLTSSSTDNTRNFFEFNYPVAAAREAAMNFFDSIPNGYYVSVTNLGKNSNTSFIDSWKADTALLGSGKSLWHKFHQMGLHQIDSFTSNKPFLFFFRKGDTLNFPVRQDVGSAANIHISDTFMIPGKAVLGTITSPDLGPAKQWKRFKWKADPLTSSAKVSFDLYGIDNEQNVNLVKTVRASRDTSMSFLSATVYPKIRIVMNTNDSLNAVPYQLKYWMLTTDNYPEGAIAPNHLFQSRDTLYSSDSLYFKVAFKNVSDVDFDSITVRLTLKSLSGAGDLVFENLQSGARLKPLVAGDTVIISYVIPMAGRQGMNQLKLEVNPDNAQPEQFHFNNILQIPVYVIQQGCAGNNVQFSVENIPGNSYQWQINQGAGYTNLPNGGNYSGVTSETLHINAPSAAMAGTLYRCISSNANEILYSQPFELRFTSVWLGGTSSNWHTPANWSCGAIPDANTDVIVKSGTNFQPVVSANATCHTFNLYDGASLKVKAGFILQVTGK